MERTTTGLNTDLYTFTLEEKELYELKKENAKRRGTVTEIFINNGYAFEVRRHNRTM